MSFCPTWNSFSQEQDLLVKTLLSWLLVPLQSICRSTSLVTFWGVQMPLMLAHGHSLLIGYLTCNKKWGCDQKRFIAYLDCQIYTCRLCHRGYHRYIKSVFCEPYKVVHLDSKTAWAITGCEEKLEDYIWKGRVTGDLWVSFMTMHHPSSSFSWTTRISVVQESIAKVPYQELPKWAFKVAT